MARKPTLKDVAAQAGVSYQTVSKVLNGQGNVAAETQQRILRVVEELDYRPNVTARGLRNQATKLIGYSWTPMPPDQANPILDRFLTSMVEAAEAAGHHVMLFPTHNSADMVAQYRELVRSNRVDGFILSSTNYDDPRIRFLMETDFPFVAFGRANPEWDFPYVDVDGRTGIADATRHLIEQGHKRIALLAWPGESRVGTSRSAGYADAMQEAGLPLHPRWTRLADGTFQNGYAETQLLLDLAADQRPTAVVALDDLLAIGAMRAAQDAGLTVGRDFGVTGFDDTPGVQHLRPSLTSVRQPVWEVGKHIVQVLIERLAGNTDANSHTLLKPQLIVRESSLRQSASAAG